MTEREALLRAVCDSPDDDVPRLVFADWLDENGEPWLAEYIRSEIELDKLLTGGMPAIDWFRANPDEVLPRLMRRRTELRAMCYKRWVSELPRVKGVEWVWADGRRGFADTLFVKTETILAGHPELFHAAPIRHLRIETVRGHLKLLKMDRLRQLHTLTVIGIADETARKLFLHCPHLDGLRELRIVRPSSDAIVPALRNRFGPRVVAGWPSP